MRKHNIGRMLPVVSVFMLALPATAQARVAAPTFSPAGGTYSRALNVAISSTAGATIRFTTNGSEPTSSSTRYTGSIPVNRTTTILVVNGTAITETEVNREMDMVLRQMRGRMPPEQLSTMREHLRNFVLGNLITRQILLDQANQAQISVGDEDYRKAVAEISATLPPGKTLDDMLKMHGIGEADFSEKVATGIRIQKLIESQTEKGKVSPAEIQAFYNQNPEHFSEPETASVRRILIEVDSGASEEKQFAAREKLLAIRKQLADGASFDDMARKHSSCLSKSQGGSLDRFPRGRMAPEFEEAAFSQAICEVGEIVETHSGLHLILVDARDKARVTPLKEAKERISELLQNQKDETASRTYARNAAPESDRHVSQPDRAGRRISGRLKRGRSASLRFNEAGCPRRVSGRNAAGASRLQTPPPRSPFAACLPSDGEGGYD